MFSLWLSLLICVVDPAAAVKFLGTMQQSSGGFLSDPESSNPSLNVPTLRTTRTAIRAYRLLGAEPPNRGRILTFLRDSYDEKTGAFAAAPGQEPDPISTGVALMILGELNEPQAPYVDRALQYMNDSTKGFEQIRMVASSLEELNRTVPAAADWLKDLKAQQKADGSFGEGPERARATAISITAMQRLGGQPDALRTVQILQQGQRVDGGFGGEALGPSDLESCYRVVRLLRRLNAAPQDADRLKNLIESCRNTDGGYGRTAGEHSSLHGTYYATIIRYWLDGGEADVPRRWSFDDLEPGTLPDGWRTESALDAPGSRWEVVRSAEAGRGNVFKQYSSQGEKKQFNLCIGDWHYVDLKLSVRLKAVDGRIDQGGGLIWRRSDPKNYYIARWNPLEQNVRMYKVVDGIRSQLDTAQAPGDPSAFHSLSVVCVGRDMRAYFDGKLLLEAEDDQFSTRGAFGLWTKADAVTEFDDFSVQVAGPKDIEEIGGLNN